jgi:hypothetical protein
LQRRRGPRTWWPDGYNALIRSRRGLPLVFWHSGYRGSGARQTQAGAAGLLAPIQVPMALGTAFGPASLRT